ncbi:hypothetical protein F4X33_08845 [Candidatus Poribacteria bacterium]|nr:hypothetical protein [Candidatus Poribacteria bacterium]
MKLLWITATLLILSTPAFSELTNEDIDKIREVIKQENAVIQSEMVQLELRITQKIQESENRLRSELNAQLNARMGDFTIVFTVTSGGFFILFATILILNVIRGRALIDKKAILVFILSIATALLCLIPTTKAQTRAYTHFRNITCQSITVTDKQGKPAIILDGNNPTANSIVIRDKLDRNAIALYGGSANGISLFHKSNKPRIIMAASEKGQILSIKDRLNREAIMMGSGSQENSINVFRQGRAAGAIAIKDNKGKFQLLLSTHRQAGNIMTINNINTNEPAIDLITHPTLGTNINIHDTTGKIIWNKSATND